MLLHESLRRLLAEERLRELHAEAARARLYNHLRAQRSGRRASLAQLAERLRQLWSARLAREQASRLES